MEGDAGGGDASLNLTSICLTSPKPHPSASCCAHKQDIPSSTDRWYLLLCNPGLCQRMETTAAAPSCSAGQATSAVSRCCPCATAGYLPGLQGRRMGHLTTAVVAFAISATLRNGMDLPCSPIARPSRRHRPRGSSVSR